jgi:hypothetical protein
MTETSDKKYVNLFIIEKYERFLDYMYPIAQNIPRKHGIMKEMFIKALFNQIQLFATAGKVNQVSKLYLCDAGIQDLKFYLRFMGDEKYKIITERQHQVASRLLLEIGSILGKWIKKLRINNIKGD